MTLPHNNFQDAFSEIYALLHKLWSAWIENYDDLQDIIT